VSEEKFDIFRGLVRNGFTFRGVDAHGGATFEHACGYTVRIGPDAKISLIAEEVRTSTHNCADYLSEAPTTAAPKVIVHRDFKGEHGGEDCWCQPVVVDADSPREAVDVAREANESDG